LNVIWEAVFCPIRRGRDILKTPIIENGVRYVNRFRLTVYAIDGAMKNKPRKPTGTSGVLIVGGGKQRFIRTQYGTSKEEVEDFFMKAAMRSNLGEALNLIGEPIRNRENFFDYSISTTRGQEYIDLMEIAMLEKVAGSYDRMPETTDSGLFADYVWEQIDRKSSHYGGKPRSNLHLLLYSTDYRFDLTDSAEELIAYFANCRPHAFNSIFNFEPYDQQHGRLYKIYPRPATDFENFDDVRARFTRRVVIDLSSAPVDPKPDANGWMPGPTFGRWSAKEGRFIKDTELSAKKTMITPDERRKQRNRAKRERKRQSR